MNVSNQPSCCIRSASVLPTRQTWSSGLSSSGAAAWLVDNPTDETKRHNEKNNGFIKSKAQEKSCGLQDYSKPVPSILRPSQPRDANAIERRIERGGCTIGPCEKQFPVLPRAACRCDSGRRRRRNSTDWA